MTVKPTVIQTDLDILSDYSLQLNRWLLKPIGAWPESSASAKTERVISVILIIICYSFILVTIIPCLLYMILEDEDLRTKLIILGPLSHWSFGLIGYTMLLMHNEEIKWCVDQVKSDWQAATRTDVQHLMLEDAKFGRYVVAFCAIFMQVAVLCFNIIKGFTKEVIQVGNETRIIRMTPVAVYKNLISVDTSPTNDIVLVVQCISGCIVNSTFVGAFSLGTIFTAHAYGQLDILMMWITEFVNRTKENHKCDNLNDVSVIVKKHLNILSFISHIEAIMNEICFMEFFKCTCSVCLLGYYILLEWANQDFQNMTGYALLLCSISFNIFVLCSIGEVLTEQCSRVGETVYMSDWYHLPGKDALDLMLVISRSSIKTKITAGKLVHLSYNTFAGVMKTAFTYLNMLLQTV